MQATATEDTMFPAYGAQTIHMPFGDVYTSLQTGVIDAAENGINVYQMNKHFEVAPIMSLTEHEANNNVIWVSDKVLEEQPQRRTEALGPGSRRRSRAHEMPEKALGLWARVDGAARKNRCKVRQGCRQIGLQSKDAEPLQDKLTQQLQAGHRESAAARPKGPVGSWAALTRRPGRGQTHG